MKCPYNFFEGEIAPEGFCHGCRAIFGVRQTLSKNIDLPPDFVCSVEGKVESKGKANRGDSSCEHNTDNSLFEFTGETSKPRNCKLCKNKGKQYILEHIRCRICGFEKMRRKVLGEK